jgi:hypothetical protein
MADRDKCVDIFFRNGLKEFEVLPPADVWDRIQPALGKRKKSLILFRVAAIVAILISLSGISALLTNNLSDSFKVLSFSLNQEARPAGSYAPGKVAADIPASRAQDKVSTPIRPAVTEKERESVPVFIEMPGKEHFSLELNSGRVETGIKPLYGSPDIIQSNNIPVNISFNSNPAGVPGDNPEVLINRWSISAIASPSYYSKVNFGTNRTASDLSYEKPEVSYSGGIAFAYKVNKRVSIQSGLYYSSIGQKISGISSYSGFSRYNDSKGGSQFSVQTTSGTIVATNGNIYLHDNLSSRVVTGYVAESVDPAKISLTHLNNSISQNFSYLEVPVIFKYKAIDRKIDVNFIGGLSYNMLVGNSASASLGGMKYSIGKTEGLSPVNFSSSLGLGFEYNLSKKFSLDLEPTFRYYLTPIGGDVGTSVHPYSFGLFTGILYKF